MLIVKSRLKLLGASNSLRHLVETIKLHGPHCSSPYANLHPSPRHTELDRRGSDEHVAGNQGTGQFAELATEILQETLILHAMHAFN